jgi:hypothetical protein
MHALWSQRIGRDCGGERRVDAARQADHHRGKAGLVHVVAQAQHHRLVDRFDVAELGRDAGRQAFPTLGVAAELDRRHLLAERGELGLERAVGAQHERATVEDQFVLAAHLVDIDEGQAAFDHPLHAELDANVGLADLVGRAVGHQQDLAAGLGNAFDDVGRPHVLADRHAEAHAVEDQRTRHRAGREDALLVEHAVVGQIDLVALADDLALVEADDGIVQLVAFAPRRGDEQRRSAVQRVGAQRLDRIVAALLERRLQHQVLRRIAREHQFRGQHQLGALLLRFGACRPHLGEVAVDIADRGIELGERDLEGIRHDELLPIML